MPLQHKSLVFREALSAKLNISFLYFMRHVGDRGQNYKTHVVVQIVYSSITPDYIQGYRA